MKKKHIVVDSSVAVKWFNTKDEDNLEQADKILKDLEEEKIEIFMPEISKYEITNALLYKKLSLSLIKTSLSTLYSMSIKFVPLDSDIATETIEIAYKNKITFYDACFLSLAKKIKGELVTDNIKHQRKNIENIKVIELKDF
ncbi:MAG: type II toxin-antitoxin system VapC family toxin [Patescibacteria group bacterium]